MKKHIDVAEMVNRFLAWKLPQDFAPDGGISFKPSQNGEHAFWPIGTNLLTAEQARQMFEHCLGEALAQPQVSDYDREFWGDGQDHSEQHLNMVQGEWVDLTDDELDELQNREFSQNDWIWFYTRAVITKFKEKNTQPVVPQGEPAGYIADDSGSIIFATSTDAYPLNWVPVYTILPTAPNLNCKSVQARLATSWGYVLPEENTNE